MFRSDRRWITLVLASTLAGCALAKPAEVGDPSALKAIGFLEPSTLSNGTTAPRRVEVSLEAGVKSLPLVAGARTEAFTYNGAYPGPTLDVTEGDHVVVHFKNNLPEATNVHWHGLHIPSSQDGLPMDLVAPGASKDIEFDIPQGTAGTYWYHPHPHGATAAQIAKGLFGAIKVRAANDPVPAAIQDTLLVLSDNRFEADGRVSADTHMDQMNGREGDTFFVNGMVKPSLSLRSGEVRRFRIVNASPAHYYRLALPGQVMSQIATEGGYLAAPVDQQELLLAPGERAEVLVKATGQPGTRVQLQDLPYDRGASEMMVGSAAPMDHSAHSMGSTMSVQNLSLAARPVMDLVYSNDAAVPMGATPATLREVPALVTSSAVAHTVTFTENHMNLDFKVNDQKFDPARIDLRSKLGTTEIWSIVNKGDMDHPFHLHGFPFQVLDRNGKAEPFRAWKDTVNVKKGETVRLGIKFADFAGPRVFHCHIIEHEDLGMMGTLQVD